MLPTQEMLARRRLGYQRRGVVCGLFFILLVVASLAPHVSVREAEGVYGRNLISASRFFLAASTDAPAFEGKNLAVLGAGFNLTYFGFPMQQNGSFIALFVLFALAAEGVEAEGDALPRGSDEHPRHADPVPAILNRRSEFRERSVRSVLRSRIPSNKEALDCKVTYGLALSCSSCNRA